jgi:ferrous iron transport protein B
MTGSGPGAPSSPPAVAVRVAIVGLPNTGKSQTFTNLSRTYSLVANYPLTTIEPKRAERTIRGRQYELVDTPGLHCLYIHSEEELLVRELLYEERPDVILQCIDANRLEQSLELTLDLVELGTPMVVALNAVDETQRDGVVLRSRDLAALLGVPVVECVAPEGRGTEELWRAIEEAPPPSWRPLYGVKLEELIAGVEGALPDAYPYRRETALLALLADEHTLATLAAGLDGEHRRRLAEATAAASAALGGSVPRAMRARREKLLEHVVSRVTGPATRPAGRAGREFARLARHPLFGPLIMLAIVAAMYVLVVQVAGYLGMLLTRYVEAPVVGLVRSTVRSALVADILVGRFGLLTLGLFNALATVIPVLGAFYLVMGVLEDVGYLPNITVLLRRALGRLGLSGRSVTSLVLGFGCKTMASLTTRGITSRRERLIANFLIAFAIPCSAQLGLAMAVLGKSGLPAFVVAVGFLLVVDVSAGLLLHRVLPPEPVMEFIQELPPIRAPRAGAVLGKTGRRLATFLREALPIFLAASVALFVLDRVGALRVLEKALRPVVVGWLGLPIGMVEVLVLSLARQEAAGGVLLGMVSRGELGFVQTVTAVTFTLMFLPCIAAMVAMSKVVGVKRGIAVIAAIIVVSLVLAGALRFALGAVTA